MSTPSTKIIRLRKLELNHVITPKVIILLMPLQIVLDCSARDIKIFSGISVEEHEQIESTYIHWITSRIWTRTINTARPTVISPIPIRFWISSVLIFHLFTYDYTELFDKCQALNSSSPTKHTYPDQMSFITHFRGCVIISASREISPRFRHHCLQFL